jgi:hypothetical protein
MNELVASAPARETKTKHRNMKNLILAVMIASTLTLSARAGAADASAKPPATVEDKSIRPFHVNVPEKQLVDLRHRITATRWPERETVADSSQGVQLATIQKLASYWGTEYDWRKAEAKLNALPQFVTTIDGLDIHFIQVKSRNPNARLERVKGIEPSSHP